MRHALRVCLLALCLLVQSVAYGAQEVDSCGGYCPLYTMEQSLKRFRDSVDGLYAGQEDAVHSITKVLSPTCLRALLDLFSARFCTLSNYSNET